jgi:NAD(P)-dependent dehydrogenase (short-subunit alcohol dehydrogenase family)
MERVMGVLDGLLDRSIFFSFDRSGFVRHARGFDPADLDRSMRGQTCLVTGANRGLGFSLATGLAERAATVHLLCRDVAKGERARDAIRAATDNDDLHVGEIDLSSLASVDAYVSTCPARSVDVLVHNAGVLPATRRISEDGLETTVATHLVGPSRLTVGLRDRFRPGTRVIFVTSGGMYVKRLDVDEMLSTEGEYDGVAAYAMTKRGQVVLTRQWARELAPDGVDVHAMHPGWAQAPGVQSSLPGFFRRMRGRLRSAAEGADTALWLAVVPEVDGDNGQLWFDRRPAPTHLLPWTRESAEQRARLWQLCMRDFAD